MRAATITAPGLLAELTAFFPLTGTVQAFTTSQSETGAPVQTWSDVAGLTDLPCTLAKDRTKANEIWAATQTVTRDLLICDLAGFYDGITTTHRFVADGIAYNIISVQWDSHHTLTELTLQVVTV